MVRFLLEGSRRILLSLSFSANIQAFAVGAFGGWSSPALLVLQSDDTPLASGKLSREEVSWIASSIALGCLAGTFLLGFVSNQFGRKRGYLLTAIPMITACVMIPWCQNAFQLCVSRFLGGLSSGASFAAIPVYVTEIASDK